MGASCGGYGRQKSPETRALRLSEIGSEGRWIVHSAPHGAQNVGFGLEAEVTQIASIIVVGVADASQTRQFFDQRRDLWKALLVAQTCLSSIHTLAAGCEPRKSMHAIGLRAAHHHLR